MVVPRVRGVDEGGGPDEWFQSLPVLTKHWFGASLACTLVGNFNIVSPYLLIWDWDNVKENFEVWRLLTSCCYAGKFDFGTLVLIYMLYSSSQRYESMGGFNTGAGGATADYAFMLLLGFVGNFVIRIVLHYILGWGYDRLFTANLVYYVLYVWSKRHPDATTSLWGFPLKATMLPFALLALAVFVSAPWRPMARGYVMGHIYYFLVDVFPKVHGKDLIHTPEFLIDQFGIGEYQPAMAPTNAPDRPQAERHSWGGGGQRLGATPSGGNTSNNNGGGGGRGGQPSASRGTATAPQRPQERGHNWGGGGQRLGSD